MITQARMHRSIRATMSLPISRVSTQTASPISSYQKASLKRNSFSVYPHLAEHLHLLIQPKLISAHCAKNLLAKAFKDEYLIQNLSLQKNSSFLNLPFFQFTRESGLLSYYEICEKLNKQNWTYVFNDEQKVPYAYKGSEWVGYDNIRSVKLKTQYILDNSLGGAMIWVN